MNISFRCSEPPGLALFQLDTGHKSKKRAVIWQQVFKSLDSDVPNMPDDFESWLSGTYDIIHEWFEGLIKGDLKKGFDRD